MPDITGRRVLKNVRNLKSIENLNDLDGRIETLVAFFYSTDFGVRHRDGFASRVGLRSECVATP